VKPGGKPTFNQNCRYGAEERDIKGGSLLYQDLEDIWIINREYKPGRIKNSNELPTQILIKILQYSSNPGDLVCDFFLGSFSTAKTAIGMQRNATGFEIGKSAFDYQMAEIQKIKWGELLPTLKIGSKNTLVRQNKKWTQEETKSLIRRYKELISEKKTKGGSILKLSEEFKRGRFAIYNVLTKNGF